MSIATGLLMAGGRPKKGEGKGKSRHVRVNDDIADMVSWILRVENVSSAQLLDPILRGPILARYKKHEKAITLLQKAEAEAARSQQE